jgi:hypothetical protein
MEKSSKAGSFLTIFLSLLEDMWPFKKYSSKYIQWSTELMGLWRIALEINS